MKFRGIMPSIFTGFWKSKYPLILQICGLHIYLIYLLIFLQGDRDIWMYALLIVFGFGLDYLFNFIFNRKVQLNLSVWIACAASFMLLTTRHTLVPYFLTVFVAIFSKYIFRTPRGHIFNPANIGVLVTLCLMSSESAIYTGQWLGTLDTLWLFLFVGLAVAFFARRLPLAVTYLAGFFLFRLMKFYWTGINFKFLIGPLFSAGGFIFAFHMITDPRTSPLNRRGQILFGLAIATVDYWLREMQIIFAPILTLTILCAFRSLVDYLPKENRWREIFQST